MEPVMKPDEFRRIVQAATLAPSLHNSQPWRFAVHGDRIELYGDRTRLVQVIDPDGRWLHLSCGAALLNARIAIRAMGRACEVDLLPSTEQPELLASVTVGPWSAPSTEELTLARAIPRRRTHREPFVARRVPLEIVEMLRCTAAAEGCWLHLLASRHDVAEVSTLLQRAEADLRADEDYRAELRSWLRGLDSPSVDGVPIAAVPAGGPDRFRSDVWMRDFTLEGPASATEQPDVAPASVDRPLVVVLGTARDEPAAWLRAGMATQRVLLLATALGLGASPLTQALDLQGYRTQLAGVVGIDGFPQMVLRLGYRTEAPSPSAGRRPAEDVMDAPRA
jgi:nitroreductase